MSGGGGRKGARAEREGEREGVRGVRRREWDTGRSAGKARRRSGEAEGLSIRICIVLP